MDNDMKQDLILLTVILTASKYETRDAVWRTLCDAVWTNAVYAFDSLWLPVSFKAASISSSDPQHSYAFGWLMKETKVCQSSISFHAQVK